MSRIVLCATLCVLAVAVTDQKHGALRTNGKAEGFVQALEFKHRLRVCNAYPYSNALDVFRGKEKLTSEAPMHYKSCKDFLAPMKSGDKLEFKVGDASAGAFSVSDLPANDAVLLLIIHRHDTLSTAVSFESHVFANLMSAQVAVIDTYKGAAKSTMQIMDAAKQGDAAARSEELRYDSVVAVNPGVYEVELKGADGKANAKSQLVALNHESYVIIRTGVEAQQGPAYPQELIVYPTLTPRLFTALQWSFAKASVAIVAVLLGSLQWW